MLAGIRIRPLLRAARAETVEMVGRIRERGYPDHLPSYPGVLANLDTEGASLTSLAAKAGVTRQAASQLIREIEPRGCLIRRPDQADGRGKLDAR